MRTKLIEPNDFKENRHPGNILFRSIELKNIYDITKSFDFKGPSLDLGCGDGYTAQILFDEKFDYGLDNGEVKNVYSAIKKKRYHKILIESAEKMSLPDNTLNFIFSNSVLEHIPDVDAVLNEISRVLKKNGLFLFTVPNDNFTKYLFFSNKFKNAKLTFLAKMYENKRNKMLNHYHLYSLKKWQTILLKHQLKILKHKFCVSKETLMFWDKIVLETYLRRIVDRNAIETNNVKYKKKIQEMYLNNNVKNNNGANLLILCRKI